MVRWSNFKNNSKKRVNHAPALRGVDGLSSMKLEHVEGEGE